MMSSPPAQASVARDRRSAGDRRCGERRTMGLRVAHEHRRGGDRRGRERRSRKSSGLWQRAPDGSHRIVFPSVAAPAALRAAAQRAAAIWADECGDAPGRHEVSELLTTLVTAIARPGERQSVDPQLGSAPGRRLVELVRAELIGEWRARGDGATASEILTTLQAIEDLRRTVEPDWKQYFASSLSGPEGLGLVVEVAHDFRSPLTSILFLAETLHREHSGEVNELQRRQLGIIYGAALGLSEMTSNVIELARGGHRLAEDERAPFSVSDLLTSVCDITRPIAEEKGLSIRMSPPASDHRLGYPLALSRVLLNLTTNALKFTEEGLVEIVATETGLTQVEFSVRDTGPGISTTAFESLYSGFRRTPNRDRYVFSGTGLGLALCRRLVEAMGSELRVESKPGWGTRFYFELALDAAGSL